MAKSDNKKKSRRRKKRIIKQILFLIFWGALLAGGYYYMTYHADEGLEDGSVYVYDGNYVELEIQDSASHRAVVVYKNEMNINDISETFYKNRIFWPYIFMENQATLPNPLNIQANTIIKIPKVADSLLDLNNTASIMRAKILADSILSNISNGLNN